MNRNHSACNKEYRQTGLCREEFKINLRVYICVYFEPWAMVEYSGENKLL